MPQSHTHLRTLQMIRKAHPHRSVHSVTLCISSAESLTVRILSARPNHPRPNFEKYQKRSADEQIAIIRNSRQAYVGIRISSVTKRIKTYHSANDPELRTDTSYLDRSFSNGKLLSRSAYCYGRLLSEVFSHGELAFQYVQIPIYADRCKQL